MLEAKTYSVLIGLGSNQGGREDHLTRAINSIAELPETKVLKKSDFIETEPVGMQDQARNFLNAVILIETEFQPVDLLEKLQIIERKLGRQTKGDNTARAIDLDILAYEGEIVFQGKNLTLPHPRLHERVFVLEPLVQIHPDWIHPKLKKSALELLNLIKTPAKET